MMVMKQGFSFPTPTYPIQHRTSASTPMTRTQLGVSRGRGRGITLRGSTMAMENPAFTDLRLSING